MDYKKVLQIPFYSDNLHKETTVGGWLGLLLETLWVENESFSGKHAFGSSGWQYELYDVLAREQLIPFDEIIVCGDEVQIEHSLSGMKEADKLINKLIRFAFSNKEV